MFKSKQQKEFEKKMAIKKTINEMNKQLAKLEESEKNFIEIAKKAKAQGLDSQLYIAINALKSTMAQKKKVQEMLLNFQIMTQTKDMLLTTSEFLKGMGDLSKDMSKLCNDKEFNKVAKSFQEAMYATEQQTERLDMFLDESKDSFANLSTIENKDTVKDDDINSLLDNEISTSIQGDDDELAKLDELLKKKLEE